eukprot:1136287-Pelagomonas_calceolata.AAC.5
MSPSAHQLCRGIPQLPLPQSRQIGKLHPSCTPSAWACLPGRRPKSRCLAWARGQLRRKEAAKESLRGLGQRPAEQHEEAICGVVTLDKPSPAVSKVCHSGAVGANNSLRGSYKVHARQKSVHFYCMLRHPCSYLQQQQQAGWI